MVMQVKKRGTDRIYAMKVLRKEMVIERNQVTHTKAEKKYITENKPSFYSKSCICFSNRRQIIHGNGFR